jgi:two-component system, OmpR family, KDP operon response regulator KdpE
MTRVLLVEDDELNRALVRTIFARSADPLLRDAQLLEAPSLARARTVLREGPVDVVLLDMGLPDGSGIALAAELKLLGPHDAPTVVAMTGATEPQLGRAALAAGCAAVVRKPYPMADLRELLCTHLQRRMERLGGGADHQSGNHL